MKLFDKALEKMIEASKPVQTIVEVIKICSESVEKLASNLATIAHNQAVHHQMIMQMWNVNKVLYKRLNENVLDTSMPDAAGQIKKDGKTKPN